MNSFKEFCNFWFKIIFFLPFKVQLKMNQIRFFFLDKINTCDRMAIIQSETYRCIFWYLRFCFPPILYQCNIARSLPSYIKSGNTFRKCFWNKLVRIQKSLFLNKDKTIRIHIYPNRCPRKQL